MKDFLFKKRRPLSPINFRPRGIIAEEEPLSHVSVSGCATITTSISSKTPCLTIVPFVPPRYSPGHPINIEEPPILSIILPKAMAAATEIVVTRL